MGLVFVGAVSIVILFFLGCMASRNNSAKEKRQREEHAGRKKDFIDARAWLVNTNPCVRNNPHLRDFENSYGDPVRFEVAKQKYLAAYREKFIESYAGQTTKVSEYFVRWEFVEEDRVTTEKRMRARLDECAKKARRHFKS